MSRIRWQTQQDSLTELEDQLQTQQAALSAKADATSTNLADVQSRLQKAKEEEAARIAAEAAARKKQRKRQQKKPPHPRIKTLPAAEVPTAAVPVEDMIILL